MSQLTTRMLRAARLDVNLYEEVEADSSATGSAVLVVVISSLAAGVGLGGSSGILGPLINVFVALAGWYLWVFLTYLVGTKLLATPQTVADVGQLARTTGFAASPGILRIFGFVPILGPVVVLVVSVWMLVAMVIAVRQALDYTSTLRAAVVSVLGWVVYLILIGVASKVFGGLAA